MNPLHGEIAALLTAVCWTYNSIVFSRAGRRVGSPTVNHIRLWVAMAALLVVHSVAHGSPLALSLGGRNTLWLALSGVVGYVIGDSLLFEAFVLIGARISMLLMLLSPIFSSIMAWIILGEHLAPLEILAILVTVAGIALVVSSSSGVDNQQRRRFRLGILMGIGGAAGQAGGLLLSKMGMAGGVSVISANQIRVIAALAVMAPFYLISGRLHRDFTRMRDRKAFRDISRGALIGPVLGVILSLVAIRNAPIGVASTLMSLAPVLLLPISRYLFHERITWQAVAGTVVALAGSAMLFFI